MQIEDTLLDNGVLKVSLTGRLDMKGTMEVETPFTSRTATGTKPVIVDMAEVDFISSLGIRLLLSSAKGASNRGKKLVLFNLSPEVQDTIVLPGLDQLLTIATSEEDAVEKALS